MSNIRVTWALPTTRVDGRPLPVAQIAHTRIEMAVDGAAEFTPIDQVVPPATDLLLADIDAGTYHFRGIVVDAGELESAPATASITLSPAQPNGPQEFTAALE